MIPSHDPVESFFNCVRAAESEIRRAAKDLESHWLLQQRHGKGNGDNIQSLHGSDGFAQSVNERCGLVKRKEMKAKSPLDWLPINGKRTKTVGRGEESSTGCLHFATAWDILFSSFVQAFPSPVKSVKKCFQKRYDEKNVKLGTSHSKLKCELSDANVKPNLEIRSDKKDRSVLSFEVLLCFAVDNFVQGLHIFDPHERSCEGKNAENPVCSSSSSPQFDHMKFIEGMIEGRKAEVHGFLSSMGFARVGGAPSSLVGNMPGPVKDVVQESHHDGDSNRDESEANSAQKLASGLLNIPLSNVEKIRSTLSTVSLVELIEYVPQLVRTSKEHPDKKKLFSVQDFFRYTEAEGKQFFEELDRDGDGQVTLEDLEVAMRKRKLPRKYAREFFRRTRSHMFSKSFGWKQFHSLIKQKDPTILRAYTTLCLSKSGTLQKNHILISLKSAGLPANEDNAAAMLRCLVADAGGSISYSHFRNFMLLLPSDRLEEDPRSIWFEAATVVAVPPPVEFPAGSVLKSALAGGLACALSTSLLHPVDTMKTRVQASTLSFPELVAKLPHIGVRGLYRGSIPAIIGQFSSHGLRTGIFEASKLVLINVAPTLSGIQVQSISSFCSTILGTAVRIPCEVMKQRLQAGIFDNVGEAFMGTVRQDGLKGFFRGTGATLCREVPFYVAGMGLYAEAKKAAQSILNRELEPYEIIIVGALSGGLAAVVTTPFDVMKTRMMTAPRGRPVSMSMVAFSILRKEGPLGLFKGAVPRFFWIAPLGAMNFAGYELAKKAMDRPEPLPTD